MRAMSLRAERQGAGREKKVGVEVGLTAPILLGLAL